MAEARKKISVVMPAYNEESNLPLLRQQLPPLFDGAPGYDWELLMVDDHSDDGTSRLIEAWAQADPRVKGIRLSRNFGSHAACHCGLQACTGAAAIVSDADLQDPPELMLDLARRWEEGSDVVWAVRTARLGEKVSVRLFSRLYYAMLRRCGLPEMPAQGSNFVLVDRKVIDAYLQIPERNTTLFGVLLWLGFRQSLVPYVRQARASGVSKWTMAKKFKLFVDSLVSFSFTPIRVMSLAGVIFVLAAVVFALYTVMGRWAGWEVGSTGYAALMTVLLGGFGLIMLMLGTIGEYLWRAFDEARDRPRFVIEKRFPPATEADAERGTEGTPRATPEGG